VAEGEQRVVAGRYRLRRLLGQGSMGTVWEAYDELLHRPVAVKQVRLQPGVPQAEADELRERTLREARAIAVVSHPNVITLHDVAREGDEPFVVMEYMPARSLAELLREFGALDVPQAATVGHAVAAGLDAAHQAGITHRDVKPGNVLVAEDGRVKLTDFGIARNVSELTMTRTGITLGSPAYISPEVAGGREVTPAADLWGLGATLFAAVEGRAPYDPDGPVLETLSAVIHGEIPTPECGGPLAEVIGALMVKDPAGRAPLSEVRKLLHPLLPEPGTPLFPVVEDLPTRVTASPAPEPAAAPEPVAEAPPAPVKLAADPGPLPFRPPPPRPARPPRPRRRVLFPLLTVLTALVLFAAGSAGGFALARVVGGEPILPPRRAGSTVPPPTPIDELADTPGDASTLSGEQGGTFTIPVPRGWVTFVEERAGESLPPSARIRYLSLDGTQQLSVERFPAFYPKFTLASYFEQLRTESPRYTEVVSGPAQGPVPAGREPAQDLVYKTTDAGAGGASGANRVTFARVLPIGIDLWVVAVTVPIEQEDTGRTKLFDKIAPGFTATG
jgi:tRNA A-37 threonylcarbamoyl transferase component Bud32